MDTFDHFRLVAQVVAEEATYSSRWRRRVISVLRIQDALQERVGNATSKRISMSTALQEGVLMGIWEMDFDQDEGLDVVLVR